MLLEVDRQPVVHQRLDDAFHLAVAELRLGLPLELRLGHLHADDGGQAFADVVALQALVVLLAQAVAHRVGVDRPRQRGAEPDEMCAALDRVDVVGEGVDALGVAVVPLHGDLDVDAVARALQVDDVGVDGRLGAVEMPHEGHDPALIEELVRLAVALVRDRDADAPVEERQLAEALRQDVEAELRGLEDQAVRLEGDPGAALVRDPGLLDRRVRLTPLVALLVDLAVAADLDLEGLGKGVHDGHAHPVQAAGDLVGPVVELAAGVQLGQHDLGRRDALGGVSLDRDAPAVVLDRDARVYVDRHVDPRAVPRQGLIDRVVHHLEHQVVEAALSGVADVHAGALADGFEAFENLDVLGPVLRRLRGFGRTHSHWEGNTNLYPAGPRDATSVRPSSDCLEPPLLGGWCLAPWRQRRIGIRTYV